MKFLSEMEQPRQKRTPLHHFSSEQAAMNHLKELDIQPNGKEFVIISERHYGDKSFDALDYLMFEHQYKVHFI